jgi:hypothetical protein
MKGWPTCSTPRRTREPRRRADVPSIRVSLTYDEAEALLTSGYRWSPVDGTALLRARGKLSAALLDRRDYVSPLERRSACNLAERVK